MRSGMPYVGLLNVNAILHRSLAGGRYRTALTLFALLALAITGVGLYGVVSYKRGTTHQRRAFAWHWERSERVIRMILRDVLTTVLLVLEAGVPGALLAWKLVSSFLYGIKPMIRWHWLPPWEFFCVPSS
jgi:hypothetical protein